MPSGSASPPGGQSGATYGQSGVPQPPGGRGPFRTGQPNTMLIATGLALCVLVAVAAWALLGSHPSSTDSTAPVKPTAVEVQAEPTNSTGSNAFTPPVGQDKTGLQTVAAGGTVSGGTPAVYGAEGDKPSCDAPTLLAYLQADPAKAGAWAQSLDIAVADIPSFVQTLSPVLLRADTSVIVHGYIDGKFDPYPAILQAGTAVFVNPYGEPTVKCFSGDPLGKGLVVTQAAIAGPVWVGFAPRTVVVIQPTPAPVEERVVVNVVTNQTFAWRVVHNNKFGHCPDRTGENWDKGSHGGGHDQKARNPSENEGGGNKKFNRPPTSAPNSGVNRGGSEGSSVNPAQPGESSKPVKPELSTSPRSAGVPSPSPNPGPKQPHESVSNTGQSGENVKPAKPDQGQTSKGDR